VVRADDVVRTGGVVIQRSLKQDDEAGVFLLHNGLLGLVLSLLHYVDTQVEEVFLTDGRTGGDAPEEDRHTLAFERSHSDFALSTVEDVGLTEVVPYVILDGGTGGHRVLDEYVTDDALIAQLELDRADHSDAEATDTVYLVLEDEGHLRDLGLVGQRRATLTTLQDLRNVVIRLAGDPRRKAC